MIVHSSSSEDNEFLVTASQEKSGVVYHHLKVYPSLLPLNKLVPFSHRLTAVVGLFELFSHQLSTYASAFHVEFLKQRIERPTEAFSI